MILNSDGVMPPFASTPPFLRLSDVRKRYGGVTALDGVDFACRRGSIHAVLGENGAGKSTLIKIVAGAVRPDGGVMEVDGQAVHFVNPLDAVRHGFVCVFQELSLLPDLSVADNICITGPPGIGGFINHRAQRRRAEALLAEVGCPDIDPRMTVSDLSLSRRQLVEFAKALGRAPRLLIMDEATSALTAGDVETVNALLRALRDKGTAILFISHRMHEVEALADTCSVFRSGRHIETFPQGTRSHHEIINLMIGREIEQTYPPKPPPVTAKESPVLEVKGLAWGNRLQGISLEVRRGEILGLGGLDGQGQRELLLALFGVLKDVRGSVAVDGKPVAFGGPKAAMSAAIPIALVPEDRKTEGLLLPLSVQENLESRLARPAAPGPVSRRPSRAAAGGEGDRTLADQDILADEGCRHAVRRQSAEGGPGQMAGDRSRHPAADGPDARHRCGDQAGTVCADPPTCRSRYDCIVL